MRLLTIQGSPMKPDNWREMCAAHLAGLPLPTPDYSSRTRSWQSGGGFSKPGIGERQTDWPSFSATSRFGTANPTCATCGGRLRGAKRCTCETPEWKPIGKRRNEENEGLPDDMTGGGMLLHLSAMQEWHHAWAVEALRVAKPGAHLLAFGGTRTHHRLMCAIEDAGWEIRDTIMWVYGCLSEDTEVLTLGGWEHYHTAKSGEILAYDHQADVYQWETPSRWSEYRVESDPAYRVVSDSTDQLVSRHHRCLVERGGKLVFVAAEDLADLEYLPTLPDDFLGLPPEHAEVLQPGVQRVLSRAGVGAPRAQGASGMDRGEPGVLSNEDDWGQEPRVEGRADLLQAQGQVRGPAHQVCALSVSVPVDGSQGWVRDGASAAGGAGARAAIDPRGMRASLESRCDGQSSGEPDPVQEQRGAQAARARTSYHTTLAAITRVSYSGVIFCPTVSTGAFVARRNGKVFITGNSGFPKSLDVSKAIDKAAGAKREVAGRYQLPNGKAWNLADDRRGGGLGAPTGLRSANMDVTAPATDAARRWSGWGTALKPAWEPIIVARKPLAGTVAENVLRYGVGALNIDGARVPTNGSGGEGIGGKAHTRACPVHGLCSVREDDAALEMSGGSGEVADDVRPEMSGYRDEGKGQSPVDGREVEGIALGLPMGCGGSSIRIGSFPDTDSDAERLSGASSGDSSVARASIGQARDGSPRQREQGRQQTRESARDGLAAALTGTQAGHSQDSGTRSRERDASRCTCSQVTPAGRWPANLLHDGSDEVRAGFPETKSGDLLPGHRRGQGQFTEDGGYVGGGVVGKPYGGDSGSAARFFYAAKASRADRGEGNTHPTVKPTALMRYLVRLVTPPDGLVLDPFMGSGSTGKAARIEGFRFFGIEQDASYIAIAKARMDEPAEDDEVDDVTGQVMRVAQPKLPW